MDSELAKLMFDQTVERYHKALNEYVQGNAAPILDIFSEQGDVSLADPMSPAVLGYPNVVSAMQKAASIYHEGKSTGYENLVKVMTPDLAYIVEIERCTAKLGDSQDRAAINLQVTSIFRMEVAGWKLLHRHADPVESERLPETQIQQQTA